MVFDPNLLGQWKSGDHETSIFEKAGKNAYRITQVKTDDDGKVTEHNIYDAHLVSIRGRLFLDVIPGTWSELAASYHLPVATRGEWPPAGTHLIQVGPGVYAEVVAGKSGQGALIRRIWPVHQFLKIENTSQTVNVSVFDEGWLRVEIGEKRAQIAHTFAEDQNHELVLTATTSELQQFLLEHVDNPEAFRNPMVLERER